MWIGNGGGRLLGQPPHDRRGPAGTPLGSGNL